MPAATGPITQIATPIYKNLGMDLQIIPISPSVADMTPQIQEAISGGADLFTITGTDEFIVSSVLALGQLGFEGDIMLQVVSSAVSEPLGDAMDGILGNGSSTDDPNDPDVMLYEAVVEKYMEGVDDVGTSKSGFGVALSFVRALAGATDAVDAASITAALSAMPAPADLPLGGGSPSSADRTRCRSPRASAARTS